MAPDIALAQLEGVRSGAVVLDPMAGSGTVLRHATFLGHRAIGVDMDPLAVLMARVWTTPVNLDEVLAGAALLVERVHGLGEVSLPWMDEDTETKKFVEYWFGEPQRGLLRRFAFALDEMSKVDPHVADVCRIALSRIIITKDRGASLARDVSHSRPHKSWEETDFDVVRGFELSVNRVVSLLARHPPEGNSSVAVGDARRLTSVGDHSVDVVLTSPPYLNAIDYMRGHRMSLVWFGHRVSELRTIRSASIGAERAPDELRDDDPLVLVRRAMCPDGSLTRARTRMVERYAHDLLEMTAQIARVMKPDGKAILVVGNSCLKGTFVQNSEGVSAAAQMNGLRLVTETVRYLPQRHRYLPIPKQGDAPLGKRMKTESVMTFAMA